MEREIFLEVKNLNVFYDKKQILYDINFSLLRNEIVCLLGQNGSGKSTLMRAILGMIDREGEVLIRGDANKKMSKFISYVPQIEQINARMSFSLLEVCLMGRFVHTKFGKFNYTKADVQIAYRCLETQGIAHLAKEPFYSLSGGQKQLGLIARALTQDTDMILLDEPVSALDLSHSYKMLDLLKSINKGVILSSHHPHQCHIADKILMLKNGHVLFFGTRDEGLSKRYIDELYEIDSKVVPIDNGAKYFYC